MSIHLTALGYFPGFDLYDLRLGNYPGNSPAFRPGQRTSLYNLDYVAFLTFVLLIMSLIASYFLDGLLINRMTLWCFHQNHPRLIHLVAHHPTNSNFTLFFH